MAVILVRETVCTLRYPPETRVDATRVAVALPPFMYQTLDVLVVLFPSGQFCSGLSDSQLAMVDVNDPTKQKIFKFEITKKLLNPGKEEDFPDGVFKGDLKGKQSKPL